MDTWHDWTNAEAEYQSALPSAQVTLNRTRQRFNYYKHPFDAATLEALRAEAAVAQAALDTKAPNAAALVDALASRVETSLKGWCIITGRWESA